MATLMTTDEINLKECKHCFECCVITDQVNERASDGNGRYSPIILNKGRIVLFCTKCGIIKN